MTVKTPQQHLETATNKVGKAIGELIAVFERHGGGLTQEDQDKVFTFLTIALVSAQQKASLARTVATATNGAFSLDMEIPIVPEVAPVRVKPFPTKAFVTEVTDAPDHEADAQPQLVSRPDRATMRLAPGAQLNEPPVREAYDPTIGDAAFIEA